MSPRRAARSPSQTGGCSTISSTRHRRSGFSELRVGDAVRRPAPGGLERGGRSTPRAGAANSVASVAITKHHSPPARAGRPRGRRAGWRRRSSDRLLGRSRDGRVPAGERERARRATRDQRDAIRDSTISADEDDRERDGDERAATSDSPGISQHALEIAVELDVATRLVAVGEDEIARRIGSRAVPQSGSRCGRSGSSRSCTRGGGDVVAHSSVSPPHGSSPGRRAATQAPARRSRAISDEPERRARTRRSSRAG